MRSPVVCRISCESTCTPNAPEVPASQPIGSTWVTSWRTFLLWMKSLGESIKWWAERQSEKDKSSLWQEFSKGHVRSAVINGVKHLFKLAQLTTKMEQDKSHAHGVVKGAIDGAVADVAATKKRMDDGAAALAETAAQKASETATALASAATGGKDAAVDRSAPVTQPWWGGLSRFIAGKKEVQA